MSFILLPLALILTLFIFSNLITNFNYATTSFDDGPLIAWQVQQAKLGLLGHHSLYNLPIFYPYQKTLTYSEPMVSSGFFAFITEPLKLKAISQYNLQLILGTLLCFWVSFLLINLNVNKYWLALFGAVFFTFSLLRFQYVVHLHTYLIFGLPLAIYGWQKYVAGTQIKYLLLAAISFLFQAFNNPMTAYAIGLSFLIFLLDIKSRQVFLKRKIIWLVGAIVIISCAIFYWPYIQVVRQLGMPFTIRDAAHFSFSLNYLLSIDVILPVISLIWLIGGSRKDWKHFLTKHKIWWFISLVGLICMLGPVAKWLDQTIKILGLPIPLPYAIIYYILPGIQSIRSVTRFSVLLALGLSLLLANAFSVSNRQNWQKLLLILGLSIWLIVSAKQYLPIFNIATKTPPIYAAVKKQPEKSLAILPLYVWTMMPYAEQEDKRLIYQLDHGKTLYNGVSGFMPDQRGLDIHTHLRFFPKDESIDLLKAVNIDLLLVQYGQYQQMFDDKFQLGDIKAKNPQIIKQELAQRKDIRLIECVQTDCLYKILY